MAADKYGMPEIKTYNRKGVIKQERYLFDLLSEVELSRKNVKFIDVQYLIDVYQPKDIDVMFLKEFKDDITKEDICKSANVYQLVESFVRQNPNSSIIIDEFPFLAGRDSHLGYIFLATIVCFLIQTHLNGMVSNHSICLKL